MMKLPSWVPMSLGVAAYAVIEWYQRTHVAPKGNVGFSLATSIYAPLALLFFAAAAVLGASHRARRGKSLEQQTGLETLRATPWKDFEYLVAEAFERRGYRADYSFDSGPDGGVDILLTKGGRRSLVQCKRWKHVSVGVTVVREMFGILHDQKADEAFIVTTGEFTAEAQAFAKGKPMRLIDGPTLWEMVREVQGRKDEPGMGYDTNPGLPVSGVAVAAARLADSSAAPTCPTCNAPMARRTARKGKLAGSEFWGCTRYPDCRGTRDIR